MIIQFLNKIAQNRNIAVLLVFFSAMLWSTSGLFIKMIDLNPLTIAGVRSIIAAILMIAIVNRKLKFNWSFPQIAGAIAYAGTVILFVAATKLTTAANAILLQYTVPIFAAIFGIWILKETVTKLDWLIIAIVISGMGMFFLDKLSVSGLWGNIMAIASAVTFAIMVIYMRMQRKGSPTETIIIGNMIAALVCLPFILQAPPSSGDYWPLILMGFFQLGLPFVIYSTALKYVKALDAVLAQTIEPLLNPIWVFLVVGEQPGGWAIGGGAVVISAVFFRNLYLSKRAPRKAPIIS